MDEVVQGVCFESKEKRARNGILWSDVCIMMLEEEVAEEVLRRLRGNNQKRRCEL